MAASQSVSTLNRLLRINRDSEHGFLAAAENVRNLGLKAILKSHAQERAEFASSLAEEIRRLGGTPSTIGNTLGVVHRGWIAIKTALTLGEANIEQVALRESLRGERLAKRMYTQALSRSLDGGAERMVKMQGEKIDASIAKLEELGGESGERWVVRMYEKQEDASRAMQALVRAGFLIEDAETLAKEQAIRLYRGAENRSTTAETVLAFTLVGAAALGVVGLAVGLSVILFTSWATSPLGFLLVATLIGALTGGGLGSLLGLLLGLGIHEEDRYLYENDMQRREVLVRVRAPQDRAGEAMTILKKVDAESRNRMAA